MTAVMPKVNRVDHAALEIQKSHDTAAACCEQAALAHKQASQCCALEDEKGARQHAKMAQIYLIQALAHGEEVIKQFVPSSAQASVPAPVPTLQQF